ncbi:MAG TPA: aquaporin, partial [Casimicrobiaceae bacterium]
MKDAWRHFAAEFIGTFALVFIGGGAIISTAGQGSSALLSVAVAHGLILALLVTATMRVSGHLNPAVTAGFLATGRIEPMMAVVYWIAQCLAATIAAYALKGLFPAGVAMAARLGGQSISNDVTLLQAMVLGGIATFLLVFVVFGTAVDPRAPKVGGFAIGLTVTADILAIGPLTGASMNPARSLGPAIVAGIFEGQAAYWIG